MCINNIHKFKINQFKVIDLLKNSFKYALKREFILSITKSAIHAYQLQYEDK